MKGLQYSVWSGEEMRITSDDGGKSLTWYPAVFDSLSEDLGGFRERINRRAFTKTLQEHDIRALFNHDPNMLLGRTGNGTLKLHVDTRGLLATVQLPDTQLGRDIETWVDRGDLVGGSFSFRSVRDRWGLSEDQTPLREVLEARLFDVAPVTFPAYPETERMGMALRSLFGDLELEDLIHPFAKLRAGVPLDADARGRFEAVLDQLRKTLPEPESGDEPEDHSVALEQRQRTLQLASQRLRLVGRA